MNFNGGLKVTSILFLSYLFGKKFETSFYSKFLVYELMLLDYFALVINRCVQMFEMEEKREVRFTLLI